MFLPSYRPTFKKYNQGQRRTTLDSEKKRGMYYTNKNELPSITTLEFGYLGYIAYIHFLSLSLSLF